MAYDCNRHTNPMTGKDRVDTETEILELLREIRDNQKLALERQAAQLETAREQLDRSRNQVEESIVLQRQAVDRFKRVTRIAVPGIALCIAMIVYLLVRYLT